jgi:hypothetical protein
LLAIVMGRVVGVMVLLSKKKKKRKGQEMIKAK